ncbi:sulfurtransferase [Brachybacterium hainanense]|uniref:Sulfurtransferase n=1 Tax=Brachybacterium hainanense TaxID=1541174 RepID=A0ABV6REZ0_9MICO
MSPKIAPVIDLPELMSLLEGREGSAPVRLLDVRWALDGSKGRSTYLAGHLPGAVYIDLETQLAAPASPQAGRHPLPAARDLVATLRGAGADEGMIFVGYDDTDGSQAGRLVWMLRALGLEAALLNGGLSAWDGELATDDVTPPAGDLAERDFAQAQLASIDEVAAAAVPVVDARAPERYRGDVEPVDPRAGHVPGAINLPFAGNVDETGRFLAPEALAARFAGAGLDPQEEVIVYCGSGVTATHDLLALQRAGYTRARLFPGSWSQWSADPERPVASGAQP